MLWKCRLVFVLCFLTTIIGSYLFSEVMFQNVTNITSSKTLTRVTDSEMNVVVVACGEKFWEALAMIKSALIFNLSKKLPLRFIIITEDQLIDSFREKLTDWQNRWEHFRFEILPLQFPAINQAEWKILFKPCAAQRLFIPSILKSVDAVLYTDTDVLFLSPVEDVWSYFTKFNNKQFAAVAPEHEDKNTGWYNRFARHPYYGELGVNSGVMLMNLTRMREFKWEQQIHSIYAKYKLKIVFGDQDIINILFFYYPDSVFILPCEYNYRPDHCMYTSVCNTKQNGIKLLHGNRGYFHSNHQPIFRAIYEAVQSYSSDLPLQSHFFELMKKATENQTVIKTNCGKPVNDALKLVYTQFT